MCYYVTIHSNLGKEIRVYDMDDRIKNPLAFEKDLVMAFRFPKYPIIARVGDKNVLMEMEWSVNPRYKGKTEQELNFLRQNMANARSEKILDDTKSQWHRLRGNKCLIPVSGTFEHRKVKGFKHKIPYYIWMKGRDFQLIPGLYQPDIDKGTGEIIGGSFTMITRSANDLMKNIHNDGKNLHRMPLFLTPEIEKFWLEDAITDEDIRAVINFEMPVENMDYHTVFSIAGGKQRPDGKKPWEYYEYEGLPPLGIDEPQTSLF